MDLIIVMDTQNLDGRVRIAAFSFLEQQTRLHGEALTRTVLGEGFVFDGTRVPLIGPQGIFKPAVLPDVPLSITTVPIVEGQARPYDDQIGDGGLIRYRYRGKDPRHRDNVGLRLAMQHRVPLIYFYGLIPGWYLPVWPVFIVGDDPKSLSFSVAVEDRQINYSEFASTAFEAAETRRKYITVQTQHRLHQESFRQRVLHAYREHCAICHLKHAELLEAAHILPDGHPKGDPIVPNGLALCKLHHAAFDGNILGINPDLRIELRQDILDETDGPMLKHGLQGFQGQLIHVPRPMHLKPNPDFLAERYDLFKKAS
jgi:putative restriction endonuclease